MRSALLVLALLASGCAAPAAELDPAAAALAAGLVFGGHADMDQPTSGAEPNLAILPDGTLFITAVAGSQERPNHAQGAAWLWRSTDDGATWETLRAPARETPLGSLPQTRRPFGSSDADVVASPDGWVYYSDWWNWGAPVTTPASPVPLPVQGVSPNTRYGSYLVERSSDGGATWDATSVTTLHSLGGIDRQWLVAGEDGWVGLFYAYFHGPSPGVAGTRPLGERMSIQAVYSTDHGETWSGPAPVVEAPAPEGLQIAHPRLTSDGLLWMPFAWAIENETYWTNPGEVRVAVSDDLGATWDVVKIADAPGGFDNLWAVQGDHDDAGALHVAWAQRRGEHMVVRHAESADGGLMWSAPDDVSAPGLAVLPWVAAQRDGDVAVGYYAAEATGEAEEVADDVAWHAVIARRVGDDAGEAWARANASPEPVKVGPLCPKGAACTADRELLDYFSLDFDTEGKLHVAYAKSREVGGAKAGLVAYASSLT